jgi:hypothetical protein
MATYPEDIDENILAALQILFQVKLQSEPAQAGDKLALRTLKQSPLQDDPTLKAPFVVYTNDSGKGKDGYSLQLITKHIEAAEYGSVEIGGPVRYLYCYCASFGTPQVSTRDQARADGSVMMTRIMGTLIQYCNLNNIIRPGMLTSDDGTKQIEGQNERLVTAAEYEIYGGESTFFSKGIVNFRYPVAWYMPIQMGPFS